MRVTRLGEGVDTNRKLSTEAIERTLTVLREYRRSMDANGGHACDGWRRLRLQETPPTRNEFLSAAQEVTGVEPELLSGDEEGRLSFRGATSDLPDDGVPGAPKSSWST